MKRIFHLMALATLSVAMLGMAACSKDEEKTDEETPVVESTSYAILYNETPLQAGDTLECHPSLADRQVGMARFDFLFANKTASPLLSRMKLEMRSGSAKMNHLMVCGGGTSTCMEQDCPWTPDAYTIAPGTDTENPFSMEFDIADCAGEQALYRLTVGTDPDYADAQVVFLKVIL